MCNVRLCRAECTSGAMRSRTIKGRVSISIFIQSPVILAFSLPSIKIVTQSYEIPCNHCGGHAFWMVRGAVPAAKKAAAAAKSAAAAATKKRKATADNSSGSDSADELVDNSENGTEHGSDDQTTVTDHSRKVKTKKPRKSEVIPRCDFIFVLLSKPKS